MRLINGREILDTKLEKPFRLIVGGGSGSGKTSFVKNLVNENHFSTPFDKIIYFYPDYLQEIPTEFDQIVEYNAGLCDINYLAGIQKNTLLIFDDMMTECGNSNDIMKLFSVIARKKNISLIFLVQNIYDNSKQFRNIRLNATGFVLFKFYAATDVTKRLFRDLGIKSLMSQSLLNEIYSKNFAYIFVNVHPERHSDFITVRSNILDKYFSVYNKMEYVAIPKPDFIKYFKIIEAKKGSIKAIKNEVKIGKTKRKRNRESSSYEPSPDRYSKRRRKSPTPEYTTTDSSS